MDSISELSDELLVKIISLVPTKASVSTSILSKRWEFLWMWVPNLEYDLTDFESNPPLRYFIRKNLPLHRAPVIESLSLKFHRQSSQPEDIKMWVGIAASRCVRELTIDYSSDKDDPDVLLPDSLYTCKSLVTLKIKGKKVLVDGPLTACLPSLKTLQLQGVTYLDEFCLPRLLNRCPVLENLVIERDEDDNVKVLAVLVPSLLRLSLQIGQECSSDGYSIDTPCLKYFKVVDYRESPNYLISHMANLEEADIKVPVHVNMLLKSVTPSKRLSVSVMFNTAGQLVYPDGIVFNQLEHLELCICSDNWSKLLIRLLKDSPKLRVLNLYFDNMYSLFMENGLLNSSYEPVNWSNEQSSVPTCLLESLETFGFIGYMGRPEERDFLSFIDKNAHRLKSSPILSDHVIFHNRNLGYLMEEFMTFDCDFFKFVLLSKIN